MMQTIVSGAEFGIGALAGVLAVAVLLLVFVTAFGVLIDTYRGLRSIIARRLRPPTHPPSNVRPFGVKRRGMEGHP